MNDQAGMVGLFPRFDSQTILSQLVDAGDGLAAALADLALDPTVRRADEVIARLQSAGHAVARLRRMLAEGEVNAHGTG